jgi:hypothetical protein
MSAWWRELQPWPDDMHFEDVETEKIIEQHMPLRPVLGAYGCASAMCVAARFAEGEIDGRLGTKLSWK